MTVSLESRWESVNITNPYKIKPKQQLFLMIYKPVILTVYPKYAH